MKIAGGCHCGNLTFTLEWHPEPEWIPARACGCSFCVKHGGVWTSCPQGTLRIGVRDAALAENYRFGTCTADFHVCRSCGVVPVVTSSIGGQLYAVVNVNTFEGVDSGFIRRAAASFEGEAEGERLERRTRNWIADVAFV